MADINTATFTGRLGSDIELKCTQSGTSVCSFAIAVERRKGKDEESATVDWIDCVAWRSTAEYLSTYYGKGRKIGVSGRLQTRIWEDKNGQKRIRRSVWCLLRAIAYPHGREIRIVITVAITVITSVLRKTTP